MDRQHMILAGMPFDIGDQVKMIGQVGQTHRVRSYIHGQARNSPRMVVGIDGYPMGYAVDPADYEFASQVDD